MKRRYNTLGRRILAVLAPEGGGPRKRTVLRGIAGGEARLAPTLARLMKAGLVVMLGTKRGVTYGLAKTHPDSRRNA